MENTPIIWSNGGTMEMKPTSTPNHKPLVNYVSPEKIRRLVALRSRGNINLQRGAYCTDEDIKKRREKILKYDFSRI